ncbi:cysteine--tRNA ligase [endosymbiont of Euscepes postfasciatus]|uniref:cysteine--tRNA ligase n=1 Tax=endosymbiont of Euscepes postfasciatus TaxID=650377 RepID=UPI000DC73BE5|nr:cysteine--tRNA ligase [endosymbiont of Euscepes postfasciatus]BBA84601.1 cysteine--tRNA ligase [endosymbiont of Euscepes postfasciatus]
MLKIFDTYSKKKKIFINNDNLIKIYVCGITPYSYCHIGHIRTFLIFDIIIRYLKYLNYKIIYVRNITDIDDKIIKKSIDKKINVIKLTKYFIKKNNIIFNKFNITKPNYEPKVTDNIKYIIDNIKILIKNKNAFIDKNGDVIFNTSSYNYYGKLSNRKTNNNFVLWKLNNNNKNELLWKSPWGYGRPGWHIECSVISNKILGDQIDIHGGGYDLLFPHHENEIAQSNCLYKNFNIKYWIHIGTVNVKNNKISKSLNNYIGINKLLNKFNINTIRYYLTKKKYEKPINFNISKIEKSNIELDKINIFFSNKYLNKTEINLKKKTIIKKKYIFNKFIDYMNDDFNIPKIYDLLFNTIKNIKNRNIENKYLYNILKEVKLIMKILGFK